MSLLMDALKKAEAATVGALGALQLVAMYTYDAADNRYLFEVPNLVDGRIICNRTRLII